MIQRELQATIELSMDKYPIIAITGPRQSGKSTLSKMLRPDYQYVNLEDLSLRSFAEEDPKAFLETYQDGVIIDEVQYVPSLFSYLQVVTDERNKNGEYIITGSQNFLLSEKISQSLAGRVALFQLLAFSYTELKSENIGVEYWEEYLFTGSYPRQLTYNIPPTEYFDNYVKTYIERDVRMLRNIKNLALFHKFLQLLAGRIGQLFNQNSLGNELGVDNKTINDWMSVLEVSFIAFRLQPYHNNFNKRLVKTPKVYFYDTGLASYLLGINSKEDLNLHFAKGQLFENLIILELLKRSWNTKSFEKFYFWRDHSKNELDLIIEKGTRLKALEIKSGKTIHSSFFKGLEFFKNINPDALLYLIYGGKGMQKRSIAQIVDFYNLDSIYI